MKQWLVLGLIAAAVGCAEPDEHLGQSQSAASVDYFLKIDGVEGETRDDRDGRLWSFTPTDDGGAIAEVIVECADFWCRLVTVQATLQSSHQTLDGPTSVWQLPDHPPLVLREIDFGTILSKPIDVTAWNPNTISSGHPWSTMALASLASCAWPSECDITAPEGWTCLPTCSLGTKIP
jgi:hypothetical protein